MNENLINLILSVKNYLLIILFLGISIIYLNAQKSEYEYDHFTVENGLPDDFIFDFDIDKNGNLWLSTRLGISIYDGFNFTPVTAIPNEVNYRSIRFDKTGRLWLISNIYEFSVDVTDKVTLYDPKTELINSIDEVFPEIKKILSQSNNYTLKTDSDNNLYMLGTKPSPIIYLEDEKIKTYQTEYETNYLSLFVKTPYTVMSRHVDGDTLTFENIKTGERRKYYTPNTNYAIELNNELIIKGERKETSGQNKYISTITSPGMDNTDLLSNPYFQHIHEDEKIILATFDKLLIYNFNSRTKYNLSNKISSSIENSAISRILKTDENIWVSTSYGLYKIYKNNELFNTNLAGTQLSVRNIYYAGDNKIFVCTERGIYEIDLLTGTEELLVDDLQAYTITKIDSSRYIIGSPSQLTQKWDVIKNEFISSQPKYPKDYIPSTGSNIFYHKDKNGNYWVLNNTSLSNYYPDQDSIAPPKHSWTEIHHFDIFYVNPLDSNILFLGNGIDTYEFDINTMALKQINALKNIIISSVEKDVKNEEVLWIGSKYKGLIRWKYGDKEIEKSFTLKDGLKSNNVHSTFFDRSQNLWMSTDHGLSILDTKTEEITTLTSIQGLHENEFNRHSALALGDSLFIYGGVNGVTYFNPNKANENSTQNPTKIIGYSYTDYTTGKNVTNNLSTNQQNYIELNSNHLNYKLHTEKSQYALFQTIKYLIAGVSNDWKYSQNNSIPIEDIKLGENKLLISRQIGINKWSPTKTITLFSPFPFYKNFWFYPILSIGLLLGIIYYLNTVKKKSDLLNKRIQEKVDLKTYELRLKNDKLLRSQTLNERLFTIIGHDLRSPLISLGTITKSLSYLSKKGDIENSKRLTDTIEKNATNTLKIIDQLLDWTHIQRTESLRPTLTNIKEVIELAIADNKENALKKDILFDLAYEGSTSFMTDKESLKIIIRNIISNAIKFSNSGDTIKLDTQDIGKNLKISIRDNGIGIDPNINQQLKSKLKIRSNAGTNQEQGLGMGLTISYELAENINGHISFQENEPKGTIATITLNAV